VPRRALKADDLTVTCAVIDGQRVLRIFRPRGAVLTTRCLLTLRLAYDASAICDPEGETQVVNRTHTRSLFELLRVPVRDDIPDMVAEATAERTAAVSPTTLMVIIAGSVRSLPTRITCAVFTIASAASMAPMSPFVSTRPSA